MTRPAARVLALLELLQAGGTRTVADLAARLRVDGRTVRRYASQLTDLGIPVRSVRGRYGGYRLEPGYRMPPLMLTDEEALAVSLGLTAAAQAGLSPADGMAVDSATAKLHRVLPRTLAERLTALRQTVELTAPPVMTAPPQAGVLLTLADAVHRHRVVAIEHISPGGRPSEREVQPYGLVAHAGRWYLTGADRSSRQPRSFRVDRITSVVVRSETFVVPAAFDPRGAVLSGLARAPRRRTVVVRVHGTPDHIRAGFPPGLAVVDDDPDADGWVGVRLEVERLDWVPGVLAGMGHPFVIERPDDLRPLVRALADRLRVAAEPPTGA